MSDWILPPVIERALIIFLPTEIEEGSAQANALREYISLASQWSSIYAFAAPDEFGELPLWMETSLDNVALAAHITANPFEQIYQAVRRIISRAETTRVVVLPDFNHAPAPESAQNIFELLETQRSAIQWESSLETPSAIGWNLPDLPSLKALPWHDRLAMLKAFA